MLANLGKRSGLALIVLLVAPVSGGVALLLLGTDPALLVLLGVQGITAIILGLMIWDQGARTRELGRQLGRAARRATTRHGASAGQSPEEALLRSLDEHEERVIRYLDAMNARLEYREMRSE